MRIAITGGNGFVGGHLTAQLRGLGHEVTQLVRTASSDDTGPSIRFSIESELPSPQFKGFDVLIHAAWDFARPEVNISGSMRLFDAANGAGVRRIVFISSLSAFQGCSSGYGNAKFAVEKAITAIDGCIIRLGFVCDDTNRGLSGSLKKLAMLPVIPLPGGGRQNLFTIRAEDLGPAFLKIINQNQYDGEPVNLAHPEPVSFARMISTFAHQQGKKAVLLPLPWRLLWAPLRVAEAVGLKLKFRSDSLVSLMNQNPAPDFRRLQQWGIVLRAFDSPADRPKMIS